MTELRMRLAQPTDAAAVAALHAESWRSSYRGILSDAFLDSAVFDERLELWQLRLQEAPATRFVLLAEQHSTLLGFVCAILDVDKQWGTLLDNLHVQVAAQGRGLGRRLMHEAAAWSLAQRPDSGLHLWVFEANLQARGFYQRLGGQQVDREFYQTPDQSIAPALLIAWPDPRVLLHAT